MATLRERMLRGEWYRGPDEELDAMVGRTHRLLAEVNEPSAGPDRVMPVLRELLASVGERVTIRPPFHCDYGDHISVGADTFVNFGAIMLDCAHITIGEACHQERRSSAPLPAR